MFESIKKGFGFIIGTYIGLRVIGTVNKLIDKENEMKDFEEGKE